MNQTASPNPQVLYERAVASHQAGNLADAEQLYLQALAAAPLHFGASHMLGILRAQQGRMSEALELIERATQLGPAAAEAWLDLGNVQRQLGRAEAALASYDRAIAAKPNYPAALSNRGDLLRLMGRAPEALASFDRALSLNPEHVEAWNNRGIVLCELARFGEALAAFDKAILLRPAHLGALNNRGFALRMLGRPDEALDSYDRALAFDPRHVEALNNRSIILRHLGRLEEALAETGKALAIHPGYAESHDNRGLILLELQRPLEALACHDQALSLNPAYGEALYHRANPLRQLRRFDEALQSYDRYLALRPSRAEAWNNRGTTLAELGHPAEALESYDKALALRPDYAMASYNRAIALWKLQRHAEALESYGAARTANPPHPAALGGLAHAALHMCDWKRVAEITPLLGRAVARGESGILPFVFLGYSDDAALQLQCARTFVAEHFPFLPAPLWTGTPYHHARIRVAYMSSDFRRHPMANCISELLELHDRARFEIIGVSLGADDGSTFRARIAGAVDRFIDARAMPSAEVARLLREMEIDILVDLNGHTEGARTEILSHRPAPRQVSYMGYPGSMGADFVDAVIADAIVLPLDRQPFYGEKILHLPDCYWVNDSKRAIAATPSRASAGLPEQGFVFCCFNNNWKITAPIFDVWMRLLQAVPGSVLWLLETNAAARDNMGRHAAARGIDPARLVFAPIVDPAEHLGRHGQADLVLDTLPYNAHTMAVDALLTGVPLVTCPGESFAGRVASSLLHAVGLPELVTQSLEDYERLALELARDPRRLDNVRQILAKNRATYPLFDTDRFRRNMESLYADLLNHPA